MTKLHPIAIRVLKMPGWRLRVWLAVAITLVLTGLPSPVAGFVLWLLALPCLLTAETLVRMLSEQHRVCRQLEGGRDQHTALLAERDARITALEADLARAPSASTPRPGVEDEIVYKQVGLHPKAPEFLVAAARKAFRLALHPDRHPEHQRQAHDRFIKAEAAFDQIARLRA